MKKLFLVILALLLLMPAALAVTREDVLNELGVARFGGEDVVQNIEVCDIDGTKRFFMNVNVPKQWRQSIMGKWLGDGVFSETEADLDGDGVNEVLFFYCRTVFPDEQRPNFSCLYPRLRVYAQADGALALMDDVPLPGNLTGGVRSYAYLCQRDGRDYILAGDINCAEGYDFHYLYLYGWENGELQLLHAVENYGLDGGYDDSSEELHVREALDREEIADLLRPYGIHLPLFTWSGRGNTISSIQGGRTLYNLTTSITAYLPEDAACFECAGPAAEALAQGVPPLTPAKHNVPMPWMYPDDPEYDEDYGRFTGTELVPDSDDRLLTAEELDGYVPERLGYIRNEILARHGYPFTRDQYKNYFGRFWWYGECEDFSYDWLSSIEMANIELIQSLE